MEDRGGTALAGIEESIVKSSKEIFALLEQVGAGGCVLATAWLVAGGLAGSLAAHLAEHAIPWAQLLRSQFQLCIH